MIVALNQMYSGPHAQVIPSSAPSSAQEIAQHEIYKQVSHSTDRVPLYSEREAVQELLHSTPSYSKEVETTVRPYSKDLVSLPGVGATVPDLHSLLDPHGRELLEDPISAMMLSPQEWGEVVEKGGRIKPFMDTILQHDAAKYQDFIRGLYDRGMIHFTWRPKDIITPFFVVKKNGRLRLVLDCRAVNQRFRDPPPLKMAAGSTWGNVNLPPGETLYIAQSDIKDYFYSLPLPRHLQPFFCLPGISSQALGDWKVGTDQIHGSGGGGLVYPMFVVTPMGWSWAMYWAQRIHSFQACLGAGLDPSREMAEGLPCPDLSSGEPIMIAYADNLNIAGISKEKVQSAKDGAVSHLRQCGFVVHEELDAVSSANSLGFHVDGISGRVSPIPAKLGKIVAALRWLSKDPKISGKFVEKIIGHCIHFMMLRRELLAIFRSLYQFVQDNYWHRRRLWPSARSEAMWAASLLAVSFADLRRPWDCTVFASDASLSGIGVCKSDFSHKEVEQIGIFKEAWRYKTRSPIAPRKATISHDDISEGLDPFLDIETVKPCSLIREDPFELNDAFPEIDGQLMDPKNWEFVFAAQMKFPEAITVLEFRAILASLRHKLRVKSSFGKKHLHFSDNLSAVLCAGKGRSSSFPMLRDSRRLCALLIAANCQLLVRWIPSEWNVADHGSRLWEHQRIVAEREARKSKKDFKKNIDRLCYPNFPTWTSRTSPSPTDLPAGITQESEASTGGKDSGREIQEKEAVSRECGDDPTFSGSNLFGTDGSDSRSGNGLSEENEGVQSFRQRDAPQTSSYQQVGRELQHLSESSFRRRHRRLRRLQDVGSFGGCKTGCKSKRRPSQIKEVSTGVGKARSSKDTTSNCPILWWPFSVATCSRKTKAKQHYWFFSVSLHIFGLRKLSLCEEKTLWDPQDLILIWL